MNPLTRIRAIAVLALSWGVALGVVGFVNGLLAGGIRLTFVPGAVSGALFASAVMLFEQSREIRQLSWRRIAIWGAVANNWMLILLSASEILSRSPSPIHGLAFGLAFNGITGSACALATLWIARKRLSHVPRTTAPSVPVDPVVAGHGS